MNVNMVSSCATYIRKNVDYCYILYSVSEYSNHIDRQRVVFLRYYQVFYTIFV